MKNVAENTRFRRVSLMILKNVKLLNQPSPNPTLTLTSHWEQNIGLGEGWVGNVSQRPSMTQMVVL